MKKKQNKGGKIPSAVIPLSPALSPMGRGWTRAEKTQRLILFPFAKVGEGGHGRKKRGGYPLPPAPCFHRDKFRGGRPLPF